jgi:hypothetical protein
VLNFLQDRNERIIFTGFLEEEEDEKNTTRGRMTIYTVQEDVICVTPHVCAIVMPSTGSWGQRVVHCPGCPEFIPP